MLKMIFLLVLIQGAFAQESKVTPCDLAHPEFDGQNISVKGKISFSRHGMTFKGTGCPDDVAAIALLLPNFYGTPAVDFELDRRAIDQMSSFFRPNGGVAVACVAITGRVLRAKGFRRSLANSEPHANGFGANGLAEFGMVLRSIDAITPCN